MTSSSPALILEDVRLARQASAAQLLNFQMSAGEKLLVVGDNGCGKTTLVESICGYLMVKSGKVGRRSRIGYVAQQPQLPTALSVQQYLNQLESLCQGEIVNNSIKCMGLFGLSQHASSKIGNLSRGWQQRVNLAQAWLGNPQLIILDEPQTALDPNGMQQLKTVIADSASAVIIFAPPQTGCEILIETHINYTKLC
ncbi:MAG: ABC-type multidrug transport system ATPase subunit [Myxococcota bacterium]|jgi:ABC-type multidrug transport system ATPase subunit